MTPARRAYSYGTGLANRHTSMAAPSRATFSAASRSRRYAAAISRRGSVPPAIPRDSSWVQVAGPGAASGPTADSATSGRKEVAGLGELAGPGTAAAGPPVPELGNGLADTVLAGTGAGTG